MSGSLLLQGVALGFVESLVGGRPWVCVALQEELSGLHGIFGLPSACVCWTSQHTCESVECTLKNVEKITKFSVKDFREALNDVCFGYISN